MNLSGGTVRVVGVDLDACSVSAALVEADGTVAEPTVRRTFTPDTSADEILRACVVPAIAEAMAGQRPGVAAVGLALPGTLRPEEGLCLLSPSLGWESVNVGDIVSQTVALPVHLVNATRANLEGERRFGTAIGVDNLVCLTLGRTIDGGMCIHGRIYDGASDSAAEIGHLTVDQDGPACTCGNQGCLETVASGPSVTRLAAESLQLGAQSVLTEWINDTLPLTAELVHRAACEGDALAIRVWEVMGRHLGLALSSVITIANPQRIVIGGRVSSAFDWFAPAMFEEVRRRARMVPRDYTEIVGSIVPMHAVLLGAAWHAFQALETPPLVVGAAPL